MKYFELFIVLILLSFYACSDDSSSPSNNFDIHNLNNGYLKLWKIEKIEVLGLELDAPSFTDEYFIFDNRNHGLVVYGEYDLTEMDTVTVDEFNYEILDDGNKIKIVDLVYGNKLVEIEEFKILKLTKDELVLEYKTDIFNKGEMQDTKLYLKSEIETDVNADFRNEMLTHKNVKLWKFTSISINGGPENKPDCRTDDYFLFATNGLALRIFGETHCIPGDTLNNDVFIWNFTEDSTAIIRKEIHPHWTHPNGTLVMSDTMQVLNLTNDEFKFASYGYVNNERRDAVITLTNYFK